MQQFNDQVNNPKISYSLREITEILVKESKLHEGLFNLVIEFQVGVGAVGPTSDALLPGAMVGVSKIGLIASDKLGPNTVDAAKLTSARKPRKKKESQEV
ncbi:MAG: hypothetical protein K8H84_03315 [Sulfuricella denitrificans]|nr:hypothetical protein [Gammaproteobacteria bacterium]MBU1731029.1 hypothetical protein [Gammaproteobacteria bacterium]MBU1893689.1 hypothetical protein [Gammaproteobacteria bacterium]MBZ0104638.1 hypothetical protein [Sulfuricella denitrificans]